MVSARPGHTNGHTASNDMASKPNATGTAEDFYASLPEHNAEPLWLVADKFVPPVPNPSASAAVWRYSAFRPKLLAAGNIVPIEEAERRVLMLVNPSLKAPCTTDTIYGGLQLVRPGETAPAHRHVAFALRFIIEGTYGFTAVEGEKIMMTRGDIILTPSWHWHDHGNEGDEPVIWLDGLDLPIFNLLRVNFANQYPEARYPSTVSETCDWQFPWGPVEKALIAQSGSYARFFYRGKDTPHLSHTLTAQAERIAAGTTSPASRETVSFMYHVVEGEGYSEVQSNDDEEPRRLTWTAKDTFAVPAWSEITHTCTLSCGNAYLVAITDRPIIESLGLLRNADSFIHIRDT